MNFYKLIKYHVTVSWIRNYYMHNVKSKPKFKKKITTGANYFVLTGTFLTYTYTAI